MKNWDTRTDISLYVLEINPVKKRNKKRGKLLYSHRYNPIPLLRSRPGGFSGSWSIKTYPNGKTNKASRNRNVKWVYFKELSIFVANQIIKP